MCICICIVFSANSFFLCFFIYKIESREINSFLDSHSLHNSNFEWVNSVGQTVQSSAETIECHTSLSYSTSFPLWLTNVKKRVNISRVFFCSILHILMNYFVVSVFLILLLYVTETIFLYLLCMDFFSTPVERDCTFLVHSFRLFFVHSSCKVFWLIHLNFCLFGFFLSSF